MLFRSKIVVGEIFSGQQVAPSVFALVDRTNKPIDDVADVDQVDSTVEAEGRRFFREPRYQVQFSPGAVSRPDNLARVDGNDVESVG